MSSKPYILAATLALIFGSIYLIGKGGINRMGAQKPEVVTPRIAKEEKSKRYELAKEITTPDGFINTDEKPITIGELIGKKVILVDFWTYSCINCQRTTPYLNAWYKKYQDQGFVIIGVHTPEFEFEKDYNNVKRAVEKIGIEFPVVLDNDYSTWTAYKNRYWPRKYLIDIDGYIIYDHIGEGAYEETETKIQEALSERMSVLGENGQIVKDITEDTSAVNSSASPEVYFGALRNRFFLNGEQGLVGDQNNLSIPSETKLNALYLSGDWSITNEFSENKTSQAKIVFPYDAKNVYFVAGSENGVTITVMKDGQLVGKQHIQEHKLYHLIGDSKRGKHTLEIIIESPGLRAYTFTFG